MPQIDFELAKVEVQIFKVLLLLYSHTENYNKFSHGEVRNTFHVRIQKVLSGGSKVLMLLVFSILWVIYTIVLTLCLLVLCADNLSKQFGPRSGPIKCQARSGFNFLTLKIFLKEFFHKVDFEKNQQTTK